MVSKVRLSKGIMKISSTVKKFIKKMQAISRKVLRKHGISYSLQRRHQSKKGMKVSSQLSLTHFDMKTFG